MPLARTIVQSISAFAFLGYGVACFYSPSLVLEFERYKLSSLRKLTGSLEIAGGMGLLFGFYYDPLRILSSGCLALLMFFAILVRMKVKDPFLAWGPAVIWFLFNIYIAT